MASKQARREVVTDICRALVAAGLPDFPEDFYEALSVRELYMVKDQWVTPTVLKLAGKLPRDPNEPLHHPPDQEQGHPTSQCEALGCYRQSTYRHGPVEARVALQRFR